MTEKFTGIVKWYSTEKGYGFIVPNVNSKDGKDIKDIFVHSSALEQANLRNGLREGQKVEFDIVESKGRFSVGNLKLIS